jgi:insertion element IS1 protein InsB
VARHGTKSTATVIPANKKHRCKLCGQAFVRYPENHVITEEQRTLRERLLLERISLCEICRAVGVGLQWLLQFMVERFQAAPEHLSVEPPGDTPAVILQRLDAELDELWSFVGKKANRQWVWIAMDALTRQIVAFHVGDRSGQSAPALSEKIPAVYQEHAVFYTDHSAAYTGVISSTQHRAISRLARTTTHVERFNCTLRQRVSRLVRATLSFSKTLSNHIGAIKYFIYDYHLTRWAALPE